MIITMRRIETNQNGNVNGNIMGYLMRSFIINMAYINDRGFNFNILQTGSYGGESQWILMAISGRLDPVVQRCGAYGLHIQKQYSDKST